MINEISTKKYTGLMEQFGPELALTVLIRDTNAHGTMREWQTEGGKGDIHFAQIEGFVTRTEGKVAAERKSVAGYGPTREVAMQNLLEGLLFPERSAPQHYGPTFTNFLTVMQPDGECRKFKLKNGAEDRAHVSRNTSMSRLLSKTL